MSDAVIIEAAVNGATTKARNPHVPVTEDEIVADAQACLAAGAAIGHHHVALTRRSGDEVAEAYPAVSSAPKIDCMNAPPRSRWRSAVPDAIPARATGTDPVSECEAGVPANPTPMPISA